MVPACPSVKTTGRMTKHSEVKEVRWRKVGGVSATGRRGSTCSVFGMTFEMNAGKAVKGLMQYSVEFGYQVDFV